MGLWGWVKGAVAKLIGKSDVESALRIQTAISDRMAEAIRLWSDMYRDAPPWRGPTVQTLNLPAVIAAKVAKMVTVEAECTVTGSARADWLTEQLAPTWRGIRNATELAAAKGGLVYKPYIDGADIVVDCIQADRFWPTAYDSNGEITGGIFIAQQTVGKTIYTRLERHEYRDGVHTITNTAYRSTAEGSLGSPCPLAAVPEWADIAPETRIVNFDQPLFVYWRMPFANNVDDTSPLGVSIYARAAATIEQLDRQYSRLIWEFEGGELAVHASEDLLLHRPSDKHPSFPDIQLPGGNRRLYRMLDDAQGNKSVFEVFSPALRDQSLLNGFNVLLRQIEQQCGLAGGTLSDPQQIAKTATEIMSTKQESYTTVADIQKSLEAALTHLLASMDALATAAHLAPAGAYEAAFGWDDSIVVDREARKQLFWQYVTAGKFPLWRYLRDYEGYAEEDARAIQAEMDVGPAGDPFGFNGGGGS